MDAMAEALKAQQSDGTELARYAVDHLARMAAFKKRGVGAVREGRLDSPGVWLSASVSWWLVLACALCVTCVTLRR